MLKVDAAHQQDLLQLKPPQSQFENFSRDTVPLNWINLKFTIYYTLNLANCRIAQLHRRCSKKSGAKLFSASVPSSVAWLQHSYSSIRTYAYTYQEIYSIQQQQYYVPAILYISLKEKQNDADKNISQRSALNI